MKTILVPIDFSPATRVVCGAARELAHALDGKVILLHVVQPPVLTSDYGVGLATLSEVTSISEKNAGKKLQQLLADYQTTLPALETVQRTGNAVIAILEEAKKRKADYIIMGTHGHTALYDLLVGSTTHGVMKRARCPVLVVPMSSSKKKSVHPKRG